PAAPGTWGSAVALVLWFVLPASPSVQGAVIVALFVVGSWSGGVAERHFGRTDPGQVVIDEVMGMLITLFMNPVHELHGLHGLLGLVGWKGAAGGVLRFRVFDVIKPSPANRLEQLHGGLGVMADDAMAALYANLVLRALLWPI